jgi:hypothetical protein
VNILVRFLWRTKLMMNDRTALAVAAPLHILCMYGTQKAPHSRFELISKGTGHAVIEIERNMGFDQTHKYRCC